METAGILGLGAVLIVVYLIFLFVALSYSILAYILTSLSMYQISKRRGVNNPWLAWVPVGNIWNMCVVADNFQELSTGKKSKLRIWSMITLAFVLVLYIPYMILSFSSGVMSGLGEEATAVSLGISVLLLVISLLFAASSIALSVFEYIAIYRIFKSAKPDQAVLFLVLSIFVSFTMPFLLFACRNEDYIPTPYYVDGVAVYPEEGAQEYTEYTQA